MTVVGRQRNRLKLLESFAAVTVITQQRRNVELYTLAWSSESAHNEGEMERRLRPGAQGSRGLGRPLRQGKHGTDNDLDWSHIGLHRIRDGEYRAGT